MLNVLNIMLHLCLAVTLMHYEAHNEDNVGVHCYKHNKALPYESDIYNSQDHMPNTHVGLDFAHKYII